MTTNPAPVPRPPAPSAGDVELLERLATARADLLAQVGRRIVGQHGVVDGLLTAVFSGGHGLLIGVPGLAKTLLVQTVAQALDLAVHAHPVHARPDALRHHRHRDHRGGPDAPASARSASCTVRSSRNIVLADEINRTPPKTQAALLQAMQERQVTAAGSTYDLPEPFFVLATQNPIEQEGTYPLPEAQLDRFMFELRMGYPVARRRRARSSQTTTGDRRSRRAAGARG